MPKAAKTHSTPATRGHSKNYDRYRGSSASRGYGHRWRKYRAEFLKEHPLCARCALNGFLSAAQHVDHIVPYREGDDFYDETNHQPLCHACHSQKTARENQLGRD